MACNLLSGIITLANFRNNDLRTYATKYLSRANASGEALEYFVRDALSGSFEGTPVEKMIRYRQVFSYLGNQNNPPDLMFKGGDAFEIKKLGGFKNALALNSSYPKNKLYSDDSRINDFCRICEKWKQKDFFYSVGQVVEGKLKTLFFVQGDCYAADREIYEKVSKPLQKEISALISGMGLETSDTNELGKVKRVDPLGITDLRVRGMWAIQNPNQVFSGICKFDESKEFNLFALMKKEKYESFPAEDIRDVAKHKSIKLLEVKIPNPNNPAKTIDAILLHLVW